MAKEGMARPDWPHTRPVISGTGGPELKVCRKEEKPISKAYPAIDNDLARDNMENDIPAADLEDL